MIKDHFFFVDTIISTYHLQLVVSIKNTSQPNVIVTWVPWYLKSPETRVLAEQSVHVNIKETSQSHLSGPLPRGSTDAQLISQHTASYRKSIFISWCLHGT